MTPIIPDNQVVRYDPNPEEALAALPPTYLPPTVTVSDADNVPAAVGGRQSSQQLRNPNNVVSTTVTLGKNVVGVVEKDVRSGAVKLKRPASEAGGPRRKRARVEHEDVDDQAKLHRDAMQTAMQNEKVTEFNFAFARENAIGRVAIIT